ncbi:MAG TPA: ferric iron uptake transcriptional regulator [Gammaproteobacteria bacterium]|nr:ferric iron uptake transcriptional regulator [Gammaproteobacteria bacterium]
MKAADLRKAGLKATIPRLRIMEVLEQASPRHMSAEDLYRALSEAEEDVGLATVYRVLTQFESAGLVVRHNFEGGQSVFEMACEQHHDHIVCVRCGKVDEFVDETIEKIQLDIAERQGYELTDHSLILYGLCPDCRG